MKCVKPSTGTPKMSRGEATTTAPAFSDLPAAEKVHVDCTATVDPLVMMILLTLQLPLLSHSVP